MWLLFFFRLMKSNEYSDHMFLSSNVKASTALTPFRFEHSLQTRFDLIFCQALTSLFVVHCFSERCWTYPVYEGFSMLSYLQVLPTMLLLLHSQISCLFQKCMWLFLFGFFRLWAIPDYQGKGIEVLCSSSTFCSIQSLPCLWYHLLLVLKCDFNHKSNVLSTCLHHKLSWVSEVFVFNPLLRLLAPSKPKDASVLFQCESSFFVFHHIFILTSIVKFLEWLVFMKHLSKCFGSFITTFVPCNSHWYSSFVFIDGNTASLTR